MGLLLLDFLAFYLVHPAQALLNSTRQLLARDRCVIAQRASFEGQIFTFLSDP
jgi:hypothetical protein